MIKCATLALALLPLLATTARADDASTTTTTTAGTLVVVTPSAPIVVQTNGGGAPAAEPALAPPGAIVTPPSVASGAPGAPQNENWSNVSHINGVPIKVGERNDYLYKFKKVNISADPFGLFFGYYDVAASYALSQNVALSVAITGWSTDSGSDTGYQATVSLPIYFRRTYSGPFLEPGLIVRSTSNSYDEDCYDSCTGSTSSADTWAGPELLFGWHWTFDSGLNIAMAAGVAKHVTSNQDASDYSDTSTEPVGYFRVGYAF